MRFIDSAAGANKMKNLVIATSMVVVAMNTAAHAADFEVPAQTLGTSGYGEIFGLYSWDSEAGSSTEEYEYTGLGGGGHVNFWLSDNWTLQIDGGGSFFRIDTNDDSVFAVDMMVHTGWRDPERGYFGAFGGLSSFGYRGESENSYDQYVVGGEGAVYLDTMTIFAQAGIMGSWTDDTARNPDDYGDSFTDAWFVRGGVRYFANPNLKLEASGGLLQGNEYAHHWGSCCRVDMPFWKTEIEYKPDDFNVSWFASYGGYSEDEPDYEHTNHTIMGGVRVHFGQDTLMSFDRSGASLDFLDTRMLIQAYDH